MKRLPRSPSPCSLLMVVALCVAGPASAQPSFQLNRFQPSEQATDGFALGSAETLGHLNLNVQLYFDYSDDPLAYELIQGSPDRGTFDVVGQQLQAHLSASLGLTDRLTLSVGVPLYILESGDSAENLPPSTVDGDAAPGTGAGLQPLYLAGGFQVGDPYLAARVRVLGGGDSVFALGLQSRITFPVASATGSHYAGESGVSVHPELLMQFNVGAVRLIANLGAHIRPNTPSCEELSPSELGAGANCFAGIKVADELTFGVGATVQAMQNARHTLWVVVEADGRLNMASQGSQGTVVALLAGLKYFHRSGLALGAGGGPGLLAGVGNPDFRVFGMLGFGEAPMDAEFTADADEDGVLDRNDRCPTENEDLDGIEDEDGCPDLDNDHDGTLDHEDSCPAEAEDVDAFEDDDGCPDVDNDSDGVLDAEDRCPMSAEDLDGFEDANGCPDGDNDGDGVVDEGDHCPMEVGPSSHHGCPLTDSDGDGVPDALDSCVNVAGTVEFHGCAEPPMAILNTNSIQILDSVYFVVNRAELERRSFRLLDNVAAILREHPEVRLVRIEGHTDSRGPLRHNMELSQQRAEAVVTYLVRAGVDPRRLTAQGFGPTRPVVEGAERQSDHALNRRVEFNIVSDAVPPTEE